jgi:hypothetical protein
MKIVVAVRNNTVMKRVWHVMLNCPKAIYVLHVVRDVDVVDYAMIVEFG